jgi:hypothetical protein
VKLDAPLFSLNDVGSLIGVSDIKLLSNWTERGLCDPHAYPGIARRGRGRQRSYSARDVFRFALMKDLAARYAVPVPLGIRICDSVLGNVDPARSAIFVVERVEINRVTTHCYLDASRLANRLSETSACSVLLINTAPLTHILEKIESLLHAKSGEKSNG